MFKEYELDMQTCTASGLSCHGSILLTKYEDLVLKECKQSLPGEERGTRVYKPR